MKAILEFNLPEERNEHLLAVKSANIYSILLDIDQWLRSKIKHEDREEFEEVREELHLLMEQHGFNLYEVD